MTKSLIIITPDATFPTSFHIIRHFIYSFHEYRKILSAELFLLLLLLLLVSFPIERLRVYVCTCVRT
jgi:hypothetical protein